MNKYFIGGTIVLIIGALIGVTSFKVVKNHNEKLLLVESKYIIEKAKECLNEKKCSNDTITLKELYNNGFLERQVNSVTKEYYNENSYVRKTGEDYIFVNIN